MPYNGSGTFTLYSPGNPVVTGTTISSTWANSTLTDLATGLSTALTKDGQTTPTANIPMGGYKLTGLAAGSASGDSVRYGQLGALAFLNTVGTAQIAAGFGLVPTGAMLDFGGTVAPTGFLGCDGSNVSRATYADLFTAIGTTWGAGDGVTTFTLPDFRRRVAVGSGGSGTGTLGNAVGNTGGAETHTLDTTEIPAHTHSGAQANTAANPTSGAATSNAIQYDPTANTASTGGGGAHNNMQPSAVVLKIIKT